jgi:glycerol-3-phosphate dehydrogenase
MASSCDQSGPSFAKESAHYQWLTHLFDIHMSAVVRRQPTSVSVASFSETQAQKTSELFHKPWFRW